jgi:hypothetical protein
VSFFVRPRSETLIVSQQIDDLNVACAKCRDASDLQQIFPDNYVATEMGARTLNPDLVRRVWAGWDEVRENELLYASGSSHLANLVHGSVGSQDLLTLCNGYPRCIKGLVHQYIRALR